MHTETITSTQPEAAVQESTINPTTDNIDNMSAPSPRAVPQSETHQPLDPDHPTQTIQVSQDEYDRLLRLKEENRQLQIEKRKNNMGIEFTSRRKTLIVRRADKLNLVSDEEVLAYTDLYKAKELAGVKKVQVTDEEICAFLILEGDGTAPTPEAVELYIKQDN